MTERLFNDHPAPASAALGGKALDAELPDDLGEEAGRGSQVVQVVAAGAVGGIHLRERLFELLIRLGIPEITLDVVQALDEPTPYARVDRRG